MPRLATVDFRTARGVVVVLDATEIHRDWFLAGLEFQLLRFLARQAGIRPIVPSSVVAEAVANHGREYARARKTYIKAVDSLRRVGGRDTAPTRNVAEEMSYAELLRERLESLWVEVVVVPTTPHDEIVARAVSRRPPFDESGSGYRDTLTWMTCVELASAGKEVYLVSQDKDFAGRDGALAPALAEEVAGAPGSVTLVRHLGKWLTPLVPWRDVTDPRETAALARDEEFASIFAPWDMFEAAEFTAEEAGLPRDAVIHDINYRGSGPLERLSHARDEDGADRIVYEFPIEFEFELSLSTESAKEAGFVQGEGSATGVEEILTVVPMVGVMTVVHDERNLESPLYVDYVDFRVEGLAEPIPGQEENPHQPSLPLWPEGGGTE
jgi:hypothetical protein